MVKFTSLACALAAIALATAQDARPPYPTFDGLPSAGGPVPSGAAHPSGHHHKRPHHHRPSGAVGSGFPHPSGVRPTDFPMPSGFHHGGAHGTGHHHSGSGPFGMPTNIPMPTGGSPPDNAPPVPTAAASAYERRQEGSVPRPSGSDEGRPHFSGAPSGPCSGESHHPGHHRPTGAHGTGAPSGVSFSRHGVRPTGAPGSAPSGGFGGFSSGMAGPSGFQTVRRA